MISNFYRRYSRLILGMVLLSFGPLWFFAESIKSNNDIETWLPQNTDVRKAYEEFKQDFGAEEVIVVGLPADEVTPDMVESLAGRLDRLSGVRRCWTPARMMERMIEFGVAEDEASRRISGLLKAPTGGLVGVVAALSESGVKDRAQTTEEVRRVLKYCRFDADRIALTGAPIIVTELDRLGSSKSSKQFFLITCAISLGLLYYSFGHMGLSLAMLGVTLWGIFLNQAVMAALGGEMNFILGSLSIMVMIFTLSIAVHVVSYYTSACDRGEADPLSFAFLESLGPCGLSTITTLLGLVSLNVSSIRPVSQFGWAAASGSVVALIVGLGVTPALLTMIPCRAARCGNLQFNFRAWGEGIARHRHKILAGAALLLFVTSFGLMRLKPDINPTEFLPRNSKVLADLHRVENELTNVDSIEAVVDFHGQRLAFLDQLQRVRKIEATIAAHPGIRHTLSLASFFPEEMPDSPLATARVLGLAQSYSGEDGLVADRQRMWRISARVRHDTKQTSVQVLADLAESLSKEPVYFTGMAPLLKNAQHEIFEGFWKSFSAACLTIFIVMLLSLRSLTAGVIAMVPNIIPIWLVFGGVGFLGMPVDIGMMMTGSIALGISVDCTFHFLVQYKQVFDKTGSSMEASTQALEHSGEPMLDSTLISSLGLLALCLSSFTPTARFGMLMAAQMAASLLGELVLLPAMLCCRPNRRKKIALAVEQEAPTPDPAPSSNDTESDTESDNEPLIHPFPASPKNGRRRTRAAQN